MCSPFSRKPEVGEPPLIQAASLKKSMAPVSASRPVEKPSPSSLSRNAQRNTQPIARRSAPQMRPPSSPGVLLRCSGSPAECRSSRISSWMGGSRIVLTSIPPSMRCTQPPGRRYGREGPAASAVARRGRGSRPRRLRLPAAERSVTSTRVPSPGRDVTCRVPRSSSTRSRMPRPRRAGPGACSVRRLPTTATGNGSGTGTGTAGPRSLPASSEERAWCSRSSGPS